MRTWEKYAPGAERWSEEAYADGRTYLARRAALVRTLALGLLAFAVALRRLPVLRRWDEGHLLRLGDQAPRREGLAGEHRGNCERPAGEEVQRDPLE